MMLAHRIPKSRKDLFRPIEKRLRSKRRQLKKSRIILAREIGVSERTFISWVSGERVPTIEHAIKWADALGMEMIVIPKGAA